MRSAKYLNTKSIIKKKNYCISIHQQQTIQKGTFKTDTIYNSNKKESVI